MTNRFLRLAVFPAVLLVLALAAYANSIGNTALLHHLPSDVTDPVLDNSILRSVRLLPKTFTGEFLLSTGGEYRPLGYALFGVANSLVRDAGGSFWHLVLIALHVAAAVLVFATMSMMLDSLPAFGLSAAYLLHPVFVPLVNDVNMIYMLWGLLFSTATLFLFVLHVKTGCRYALAGSLVFFAASALSYRHAMLLPPFLAMLSLLAADRPKWAAGGLVALGEASFIAGVLRLNVFVTMAVLTTLVVFVGVGLSASREARRKAVCLLPAYLALVAVFAVLAAWMIPSRLHGYYLDKFLHGEIHLAAPFQPSFVSGALLTGSALNLLALALAALLPGVLALPERMAKVVVPLGLAFLLLATVLGNGTYQTSETYWNHIDAARPGYFAVEINLAEAHLDAANPEPAKEILLRLLYDDRPSILYEASLTTRLGRVYAALDDDKTAGFYFFGFGFKTNWYRNTMKNSLRRAADFCFRTGYISCAEYFWASGLVLDRYDARLYNNLGRALVYKNFFRSAEKHFHHALVLEPGNDISLYYLAFIAQALGRERAYPHYCERWKAASGSETEIDFQRIYDGFLFERDKMMAWFSGEPRFLSRFGEWAGSGPYVLRRNTGVYAFPEVSREIGSHFLRQGEYDPAYEHLSASLQAGPSIAAVEMLIDVCVKTGRMTEAARLKTMLGSMRQ